MIISTILNIINIIYAPNLLNIHQIILIINEYCLYAHMYYSQIFPNLAKPFQILSRPAKSFQIWPSLARSRRISSHLPVQSCQISPNIAQITPNPVKSFQILANIAKCCPILPNRAKSYQILARPVKYCQI